MGCGASNNNSAVSSGGSRPSRPANTTTVPVQRSSVVSKPLIKSKNYRHGSNLTQRDLVQMRNDFWSSRVEGNVHMWQNIRSAAEALVSNDLMLANAILEASHIVTPTGTMETLYDERGVQYKLPIFCISNPIELCGETPAGAFSNSAGASSNTLDSSGSNLSTSGPVAVASPVGPDSPGMSGSRSGTRIVEAQPLNLKIRINPGDINMTVMAQATYSIGELKHCIVEQSLQSAVPIPDIKEDRQRIIFMGRELQNTQRLNDLGFDEQKVVQVFLRPQK